MELLAGKKRCDHLKCDASSPFFLSNLGVGDGDDVKQLDSIIWESSVQNSEFCT